MTVHIALLRAVNVGGHGAVKMNDLRLLAAGLGFSDVQTVLQSGNLVFRGATGPPGEIASRLESAARSRLGLPTDFIVRTAAEWAAALARNPFRVEARDDPSHLLVVFLRGNPPAATERRLQERVRGPEKVRLLGAQAYIVYPEGIARSRLTLPVIEAGLGFRGTGRNWNTVTKLAELASR